MALKLDDLLDRVGTRPPISVTMPTWGEVFLRYPTAEEWHDIVSAQQGSGDGIPPLSLICRVMATCMADDQGNRLMSAADARRLHDRDAAAVMQMFQKIMATVMVVDDQQVSDAEKK